MSKVHLPTRRKVYWRDQWCCTYCGCECIDHRDTDLMGGDRSRTLTVDHVLPTAMGGKSRLDNLVTACLFCNVQKGKRTGEEYRAWLAARKVAA